MERYIEFIGNHPVLFAALVAVLVFIVVTEVRQRRGPKALTAREAVRLINDTDARVVDVRDVAAFKSGHLLNAVHIPQGRLAEEAGRISSDKSRPVIVYCKSGTQSAAACRILQQAGYEQVYHLKGGMYGWQDAGMPVER